MAQLNIYLSRDRDKWLRQALQDVARAEQRSISFIVEEALVKFMEQSGRTVPNDKRKDHRSHATQ